MIRAAGFCENPECGDFHKGVFLLNQTDTFCCPGCRQMGFIEAEKKTYRDLNGVDKQQAVYREARVKYDYKPNERKYGFTAVVSIPGMQRGAVFEIASPLFRTERRALKLAEYALCTVNSGRLNSDGLSTEIRIDLCSPEWKEQIEHAGKILGERDRRLKGALEVKE